MQIIELTQGMIALIDDEDYALVSGYFWHASLADRFYYAVNKGRETTYMHRLIMGVLDKPDIEVDHRSGCTLDNRRANLRECTSAQNKMNTRVRKTGKYSRFKGVGRQDGYWIARIHQGKERIWLGTYNTEEEAAHAYDAGARKHFGDFARLNFPQPGEMPALSPIAL